MAVIVPTRRVERRLAREGYQLILGVDEVGVACSSGPVVACALAMPSTAPDQGRARLQDAVGGMQRERLAVLIRRQAVSLGWVRHRSSRSIG
jgi:ribonuclease HII